MLVNWFWDKYRQKNSWVCYGMGQLTGTRNRQVIFTVSRHSYLLVSKVAFQQYFPRQPSLTQPLGPTLQAGVRPKGQERILFFFCSWSHTYTSRGYKRVHRKVTFFNTVLLNLPFFFFFTFPIGSSPIRSTRKQGVNSNSESRLEHT